MVPTQTLNEFQSPYCPVCSGCGEDGCCRATICQHKPEGLYCEFYLRDLRFGYWMYKDLYEIISKSGDKDLIEKLDITFDKNWDIAYGQR